MISKFANVHISIITSRTEVQWTTPQPKRTGKKKKRNPNNFGAPYNKIDNKKKGTAGLGCHCLMKNVHFPSNFPFHCLEILEFLSCALNKLFLLM